MKPNRRDIRNLVKFGLEMLGGVGAAKIVQNISPYEGIFGTLACSTFGFFIGMATVDMIDEQFLKCEKILAAITNGEEMVVV